MTTKENVTERSGYATWQSLTKTAFTLAEVLITLVIIGIIAAITVPVIMNNAKWAEYKSGAFKAKNVLDNAMRMYHAKEGEIPQCGYWEQKNPYGSAICAEYDANGDCVKRTLANGDPFPADYNGPVQDCTKVHSFLLKNLNVTKYCDKNAYENGCIPHYDGVDTIQKNSNPNKSDEEINKDTSSYKELRTDNLKRNQAIVTTDGMIFIPYSSYKATPFFLVDVNGQKGPNKFGYDVIGLRAIMKNQYSVPKYVPYDFTIDKGGRSTKKLMYAKD